MNWWIRRTVEIYLKDEIWFCFLSNLKFNLTHQAPTPQNGQRHSNSSSATAVELLQCVWPFYGAGGLTITYGVTSWQNWFASSL